MSMGTDEVLNELLVRLFKDLMEIEGRCLVTEEFSDISNNDMHIIEAVGYDDRKSMSAVAKLMSVTTGTLTKAIDNLSDKGYVIRERSTRDKRVVWLSLTIKGQKAYRHHEQFHQEMIAHIKEQLTEQESTVLIYALAKLVDYFQQFYGEGELSEDDFSRQLFTSVEKKIQSGDVVQKPGTAVTPKRKPASAGKTKAVGVAEAARAKKTKPVSRTPAGKSAGTKKTTGKRIATGRSAAASGKKVVSKTRKTPPRNHS